MAIHPKAWLENAPGRKQHYVMPAPDVTIVEVDGVSHGVYIDGTVRYQGYLDAGLVELLTSVLGGDVRQLDEAAFEEGDSRFPPRLGDIEWEATNQDGPINPLRVTGMDF